MPRRNRHPRRGRPRFGSDLDPQVKISLLMTESILARIDTRFPTKTRSVVIREIVTEKLDLLDHLEKATLSPKETEEQDPLSHAE